MSSPYLKPFSMEEGTGVIAIDIPESAHATFILADMPPPRHIASPANEVACLSPVQAPTQVRNKWMNACFQVSYSLDRVKHENPLALFGGPNLFLAEW